MPPILTTPAQNNMSRIPVRVPRQGDLYTSYHDRTVSAPSKLEQLQAHYQRQLMKQKEEKIAKMYQDNQQRALNRMNNNSADSLSRKGTVRDYFRERRAVDNGSEKTLSGRHYNNGSGGPGQPPYHQNVDGVPRHTYKKNSAGRDRAQLLAPIQKSPTAYQRDANSKVKSNSDPTNKPPFQKPRLARPYNKLPTNTAAVVKQVRQKPANNSNNSPDQDQNDEYMHAKQGKLKNVRQNRSGLHDVDFSPDTEKHDAVPKKNQKMSDFEKWTIEQEAMKAKRLQQYQDKINQRRVPSPVRFDHQEPANTRPRKPSTKKGMDDDFKQKEQELLDLIERQQAELNNMRVTRENKEKQAYREAEKWQQQEQYQNEQHGRAQDQSDGWPNSQDDQTKLRLDATYDLDSQPTRQPHDLDSQPTRRPHDLDSQPTRQPHVSNSKPALTSKPKSLQPPKKKPLQSKPTEINETDPSLQLYLQAHDDSVPVQSDLDQCSTCGRQFAADRLKKHQNVCVAGKKKRKVFDPVKMRLQGTEAAQYAKKGASSNRKQDAQKKSNWRSQHENFIKTIRYAKKVQEVEEAGGSVADLPPPPVTENPDYVQCPYCQRKFNESAAERHVPRCKEIKSRPPPVNTRRR